MPELVSCPHCEKKLRVPDNLVGRNVKCPGCGNTFVAEVAGAAPPPPAEEPEERPRRRRTEDEEITERPRRSRREDEEEYEEDRPRRRRDEDYEDEEERRPRRSRRREAAQAAVLAPAIAMMIIGVMGIGVAVLQLVVSFSGIIPPQRQTPVPVRLLVVVVYLIWGLIVTLGGFQLKSMKSRVSAMIAAIFAMLPCNLCCLAGIPIGIWALVVMSRDDVKASFR